MIVARTFAILAASAILALSAGYATHWLLVGNDPINAGVSEAADTDALFATKLPDLAGADTSISRWRGQILVVNFWATWCAPCREEIPSFIALQDEYGTQNVQFLGIAADRRDKVGEFAREFKINYPILIGDLGALELSAKLGNRISSLPFTVIVDRKGHIAHRQLGILKAEKLRTVITALNAR